MERETANELAAAHVGLVKAVARQLARQLSLPPQSREDLESAGAEGLIEASRRYDPSRGASFPSFARHRIRGAMIDALRRESGLPRRTYDKLRAAEAAALVNEAALEELSAPAAPGTTAAMLDAKLAEHLAALATAMAMGLVARSGIDEGEIVAVDTSDPADEQTHRKRLRTELETVVATLPDQERRLVAEHYFADRQFDEVAKELGMSKSWASRLHKRAMSRLADALRDGGTQLDP